MRVLEARLVASIRAGRPESARALLSLGADPDADLGGITPLGVAALERRSDCAKALLEAGADPNLAPEHSFPLLIATAKSDIETAREILERAADPNARDKRGQTPLHYAASAGDAQICRLLLAFGADPNAPGLEGETPLHVSRPEAIRDLLESGASLSALDARGRTPAETAPAPSRNALLSALIERETLGDAKGPSTDLGR